MRKFLAAVVMAISLAPLGAFAQERVGDAALGGLSGALVFGPVGAVAGIVVGYAAGPGISRSWGLRRPDPRYADRAAQRSAVARSNNAELKQATAQSVSAAPPRPAPATKRTWDSPPVLGFE
jgi:outer membrane lipoprotein SlyB